jgi:hypothetical protein
MATVAESVAPASSAATATPSEATTAQPIEQFEVEEAPSTEDNSVYPTGAKLVATTASLLVSLVLLGLDLNIVATATPAITSHFKTIKDIGCEFPDS